jgi:hypothetical protein
MVGLTHLPFNQTNTNQYMDLKLFIETYDYPGCILLFGGKRDVRDGDQDTIASLGRLLGASTKHMLFRSGNALGADELFSKGIAEHAPTRLQVVVPYAGHRALKNVAYETISLDQLNLASEPEVSYQSLQNQNTKFPVKEYLQGKRDNLAMKGSYIIRDTVMVIGAQGVERAHCALFYDDLQNPRTGGTGHTMNVCKTNEIPFLDQCMWLNWLNDMRT